MSILDLAVPIKEEEMSINKYKICVVGAGHVGLVTAACFSELEHKVICVDCNRKKIEELKKGKIPFYEPKLSELVRKNTMVKRLEFSVDLKEAIGRSDVIFIAVWTPPKQDGSADVSAVEAIAREIAENMNGYKLIVEKSTVPVQTGKKIKETILRYRKNSEMFDVASNPEFLREGRAVDDFIYPQRVVIGVESKRAEEILRNIYAPLKAPLVVTDINTAELIKHACNSFLAMKISFINAIARICDLAGADVEKVAFAMGLDERIGKSFLKAGVGYGGFCFPKDVEAFIYISKKLGYDFKLLEEVKNINESQKLYFVEKIKDQLWVLKDKKIAILGLSFKPETDDMRFAPSLDIIKELLKEGAILKLYDPQAMEEAKMIFSSEKEIEKEKLRFVRNAYEAVEGCDCACFLTEWEEFKQLDFQKLKMLMRYPVIADGRNMLDKDTLNKLGFKYMGIGR